MKDLNLNIMIKDPVDFNPLFNISQVPQEEVSQDIKIIIPKN